MSLSSVGKVSFCDSLNFEVVLGCIRKIDNNSVSVASLIKPGPNLFANCLIDKVGNYASIPSEIYENLNNQFSNDPV
jgi:hypothetical protein